MSLRNIKWGTAAIEGEFCTTVSMQGLTEGVVGEAGVVGGAVGEVVVSVSAS